jgi:hypothetical protein
MWRSIVAVAFFGAGIFVLFGSLIASQDAQDVAPQASQDSVPQGMQVLSQGPIHEAFAEPVESRPEAGAVVPKQPPDPIEEVPPDQKPAGENVEWIPGYWAWDDGRNDFLWVSGIWRSPPPDKQWVPGHWTQVEGGSQWTSGFWADNQSSEVSYLPQPPEPVEATASTPAPSQDSTYVPGNWVYMDNRYAWRAGYWVTYRPGWIWVPAHYVWTPYGCVYVEGYWDFALDQRGLLFAPVFFERPLWQIASWAYRPRFVVYTDFLFGCLFVGPGRHHYYFGDYFESNFARRGYTPWINFSAGRVIQDPLFSYYRWSHRSDPRWAPELRAVYSGRRNGTIPRPPHDLSQQRAMVGRTSGDQGRNVMALASINHVDHNRLKLEPVPAAERNQFQRSAQHYRQLERQRGTYELRARGPEGEHPGVRPESGRPGGMREPGAPSTVAPRQGLKLERAPGTSVPNRGRIESPPRPSLPKAQARGEVPRTEARPGAYPEARPAPRPEARPAPRPEARPAPHPEARPAPRPENRPAPLPEARPEARPAPHPEARPAPRPEAKPAPRPEPRPAPAPKPEPRPAPRAEPQARPPAEPPHAQPRPAPRPQPRPPEKPEHP